MAKELTGAQAWKHINDMFGGEVRHPRQVEEISAFTSRSPALDRALQVGGWARGRIYQLAGKPSSGKTFMSLIAIAEWQSLDPENCCMFIDAEYTYDPVWAQSLGVDNDRVLLVKTNDGKKIFTGLVGTPKVNRATKKVTNIPGLLNMIENGQLLSHVVNGKEVTLNLSKMGVIVLDSVAAIQAPAEAQSEVGKVQVAPLSRFLTVELRKLTPLVANANVCFIAINHVKTKIGVMFGNPEVTPGGAAWKHACSVMLMVAPMSGADNILVDENEEKYGHKIRIKVEKNKMGRPNRRAEFFIDFTSGVTEVAQQLLELGVLYKIIERPNNRTYIIEGKSLTSKSLALDYIGENLERIEELVRACYIGAANDEGEVESAPKKAEDLF